MAKKKPTKEQRQELYEVMAMLLRTGKESKADRAHDRYVKALDLDVGPNHKENMKALARTKTAEALPELTKKQKDRDHSKMRPKLTASEIADLDKVS